MLRYFLSAKSDFHYASRKPRGNHPATFKFFDSLTRFRLIRYGTGNPSRRTRRMTLSSPRRDTGMG
jgi:hypothetical protein